MQRKHAVLQRPLQHNLRALLVRTTLLWAAVCFSTCAVAKEWRTNKIIGAKEELIFEILQLAISKVDPKDSAIQLDAELPLGRLPKALEKKHIDIMWAGSSKHYDEHLLAIRIPLLKGLLGHRIFIIQSGTQEKFDKINHIDDLKPLRGGLSSRWGTTLVLKQAGLNIVESVSYENLFHMLANNRFDYYPRAIHEPWNEIAERPELNLDIEKNLVLVYPYAMHFYLRKEDTELKAYIEKGLKLAIADGSFDTLFYSNPLIQSAIQQSNFKQRRVLRLTNPYLHKDTPLDNKSLWLDLDNL